MNEDIKSVGEYLPKPEYGFDAVSVSQVINKDMLINGFEFFPTKWGEGVYIRCTIGGEPVKVYTHSQVLVKQAHFVAEHLPLRAKVIRQGRYYTFE